MRSLLILLSFIALALLGGFIIYRTPKGHNAFLRSNKITEDGNKEKSRLQHFASGIQTFLQQNNCNSSFCFFIDMKMPSGSKRFFVYDINKDSVLLSGLVTHGSGTNSSDTIQYSNIPGSNCTSLGKYRIGQSYYGKFGLAYKLHGLDKTNSNAFNRFVVLHSHACVPDDEIAPNEICSSWGCPTVSPTFLNQLKTYISINNKPVLLWIFN